MPSTETHDLVAPLTAETVWLNSRVETRSITCTLTAIHSPNLPVTPLQIDVYSNPDTSCRARRPWLLQWLSTNEYERHSQPQTAAACINIICLVLGRSKWRLLRLVLATRRACEYVGLVIEALQNIPFWPISESSFKSVLTKVQASNHLSYPFYQRSVHRIRVVGCSIVLTQGTHALDLDNAN